MSRPSKIDIPTMHEKMKEGYDNKELAFYFGCSVSTVIRAKSKLNTEFKEYTVQCPYCQKDFRDWKSVRHHVSQCDYNTNDYAFCEYYGAILHSDLRQFRTVESIKEEYPRMTLSNQMLNRILQERRIRRKTTNEEDSSD